MDERQEPVGSGAIGATSTLDAAGEALIDVALLGELLGAEPGELTDGEVADGVLALVKLAGQADARAGRVRVRVRGPHGVRRRRGPHRGVLAGGPLGDQRPQAATRIVGRAGRPRTR